MKYFRFIVLLGVLGCSYPTKTNLNWKKGYVDEFGKYVTSDKKVCLEVAEDNNILKYTLINGNDTISSKERASIFQQWALYLDEDNNLWVESSDIGTWVWVNGVKYQKYWIDQKPSNIAIPKAFFDGLCDSHKKYVKKML